MKNKDKGLTTIGLMIGVIVLLLIASVAISAQEHVAPAANGGAIRVTGTYQGSVTIHEPASLGALDLVFTISDEGGVLSGQVSAAKTQVFLGGPSFTGSVTASQGVTPTFQIESEVFASVVSGRPVRRQFTLVGEILAEADTLRGQYTETILGFTPQPLLVKGKFLVVRPDRSEVILPDPGTPATATPTATATATTDPATPATATATATATSVGNPGGGTKASVYMPVIVNNGAVVNSLGVISAEANMPLAPTPSETPQPTGAMQTDLPSATPEPAQADTAVYLPVIVR